MRFRIETLIVRCQLHAGLSNHAKAAPFAVTVDGKHLGDRFLGQCVTGIGYHAAILIVDKADARDFLFNQHADTLQ
ncbi:hypothetical protein D3C81_2129370 [compost metagenome]